MLTGNLRSYDSILVSRRDEEEERGGILIKGTVRIYTRVGWDEALVK